MKNKSTPELSSLGLSDIAPVLNLILAGSRAGHFTSLYLQWLYVAGLAKQLFGLKFTSRITLPDGSSHQASTKVLRVNGDFAGFFILRNEERTITELYMCAVLPQLCGQGIGTWMLKAALDALPDRHIVFADCLPSSLAMLHVLRGLGFEEIHRGPEGGCRMCLVIDRIASKPSEMGERQAA